MDRKASIKLLKNTPLAIFLAVAFAGQNGASLSGKQKAPAIDPNDPTLRLYQLIDTSYGGKVTDFYVLADVYKDQKNPNEELQRVLRVEYDKNHAFGRLNLYVRTVAKMEPEQAKAYTPKMVYEFGVADSEKFVKTEAGPFGKSGDLYLHSVEDRPLSSAPITDETRKAYERLITEHIIPALQKK